MNTDMLILRSPHAQAGLFGVLVAVLMLLPGSAIPPTGGWLPPSLDPWLDKMVHVVLFLVLTLLLVRSARASAWVRRPRLAAWLITVSYALVLETAQVMVPERRWESGDLVADLVGVLLGLALASRLLDDGFRQRSRP